MQQRDPNLLEQLLAGADCPAQVESVEGDRATGRISGLTGLGFAAAIYVMITGMRAYVRGEEADRGTKREE